MTPAANCRQPANTALMKIAPNKATGSGRRCSADSRAPQALASFHEWLNDFRKLGSCAWIPVQVIKQVYRGAASV